MAPSTKFDIFSGARIEAVEGLAKARERMRQLAEQKPGKYFILDTATHTVVASIEKFATPHPRRKSRLGSS